MTVKNRALSKSSYIFFTANELLLFHICEHVNFFW